MFKSHVHVLLCVVCSEADRQRVVEAQVDRETRKEDLLPGRVDGQVQALEGGAVPPGLQLGRRGLVSGGGGGGGGAPNRGGGYR